MSVRSKIISAMEYATVGPEDKLSIKRLLSNLCCFAEDIEQQVEHGTALTVLKNLFLQSTKP